MTVQPKKSLGQHFLKDQNIIRKIIVAFEPDEKSSCIEIGPGTGALTTYLLEKFPKNIAFVEIDQEAYTYLCEKFPQRKTAFINANFLKMDLSAYTSLSLIGNLPYNISSQIIFKILENRPIVDYGIFMVQKEVAARYTASPNTKDYGILSVLLQTFYQVELLFTVSKNVFVPPPKVESAVFRIIRKNNVKLPFPDSYFFAFVKMAFNQRRKMLRKSLQKFVDFNTVDESIRYFADKRPEQLTKEDFLKIVGAFFYTNRQAVGL